MKVIGTSIVLSLMFAAPALGVNPLKESMAAYEAILESEAIDFLSPADQIVSISLVQQKNRYRLQTGLGCEVLVDVVYGAIPPQFLGQRPIEEVKVLEVSKNLIEGTENTACQ
jgi:hypothetical protein